MVDLHIINVLQQIPVCDTAIDNIIELCRKYQATLDLQDNEGFTNSQLINEVIDKLKRLKYIIKEILLAHKELLILVPATMTPMPGGNTKYIDIEMEKHIMILYVQIDSFYYTANRIFVIFRDFLQPKAKFKADGIRDVRNRLIEHPEVLSQALDITNLVLKNSRTQGFTAPKSKKAEDEVFNDKGFFKNLEEFVKNLHKKVEELTVT
ncbi:hypothetical protein [Halarcobacter sp.]|uniref:hypothetical protein n=1 Tax=Halarcobacter sp. TaxID=2321133 RepID=UPI003A8F0769